MKIVIFERTAREYKRERCHGVKRIIIKKRICWVSERCGFACFRCHAEIRVLLMQAWWRGLSNSRRIITQTAVNVPFCYWIKCSQNLRNKK